MSNGKLITFEGLDFAGKSTQAKILMESMRKEGHKVWFEHFPRYDKPIGALIKVILNNNVRNSVTGIALQMLYIADQLQAKQEIYDHLNAGETVILDRYDLSTKAFMLATTDCSVERINNYQDELIIPDLTFIFDMPVEEIANRKTTNDTLDKHERNIALMERVRATYRTIELMNYQRPWHDRDMILVDATQEIKDITNQINMEVNKKWAI